MSEQRTLVITVRNTSARWRNVDWNLKYQKHHVFFLGVDKPERIGILKREIKVDAMVDNVLAFSNSYCLLLKWHISAICLKKSENA